MKNNQYKPLVSVIMPVYNAGDFLVEAIESILQQTFRDFELIIVDDKSTDQSWKIISKYQKKYPSIIKALRTEKTMNRGGDSCANEALKLAQGKYIARMDADDISHPTRFQKQVEFLEKNSEYFLVGSNAYVINKTGKIIGAKKEPLKHNDIFKSYFTFHPIIHPSAMYHRIIDSKSFFYPKKFSANNDYYAFFELIANGKQFANLEEKLIYYRIHGHNNTFINMKKNFSNTLKIRLIMVNKYNYSPTIKQWLICLMQLATFTILPEKILTNIYLLSRGIIKPEQSINKVINKIRNIFPRKNHNLLLKSRFRPLS